MVDHNQDEPPLSVVIQPSNATRPINPSSNQRRIGWAYFTKYRTRPKRSKQCSIELLQYAAGQVSACDPHHLAAEGKLEQLRACIEVRGLSIKTQNAEGATLLHAAAKTDQLPVLQYLVESGIGLDETDSVGNTALHVATIYGNTESLHFLLNVGASDTKLNNDKDAPLHIAVRHGRLDLFQAFLQHPDINLLVEGYRKRTVVHLIAEYDHLHILEELNFQCQSNERLKEMVGFRLCATDEDGLKPVHIAARSGSHKVLDSFLNCCIRHGYARDIVLNFVDEENNTALHAAIDAGFLNIVKVLLNHGASPTCVKRATQMPPLHLACHQGKLEMVKAMVEACGPEILQTQTPSGAHMPLHMSAHSIHCKSIIQFLVEQGAEVDALDSDGRTPLVTGIIYGSLEAVKQLIQSKANALVVDKYGKNVLHHAITRNRKAILIELLKEPGVDDLFSNSDHAGQTPLHCAFYHCNEELVCSLLPVILHKLTNIKDNDLNNFLHLAVMSGKWKALKLLLGTSISEHMLNEINAHGGTPLHAAAHSGHLICVEFLLAKGAMVHKCHAGLTPFHSAVAGGHVDCAQSLFHAHPFQKDWVDDQSNTALHHAAQSDCPNVLQLCLDLGISVTRNDKGQTFLDCIIENNSRECALVVVRHTRWQECLDFPVMEGHKHAFLQFIDQMPEVAKAILDRCCEKSTLSPDHPQYWEKYDFKYLRLSSQDLQSRARDSTQPDSKVAEEEDTPLITNEEFSPKEKEREPNLAKRAATFRPKLASSKSSSTTALDTMLRQHRIVLLNHTIVVQYLKTKWRAYGRLIFGLEFFLWFLQVIFMSIFVIVTSPTRLNVTDEGILIPPPDNSTVTSVSFASSVLKIMVLVTCVLNTVIWLVNVVSNGLPFLNIAKHELLWVTGGALVSTYAFLPPWTSAYWEAGSVAIFLAWFGLVLFMEYIDLLGIYVTMLMEVLKSLVKVSFLCGLFVIAFGFSFFILVGDVLPFDLLGHSFFIIFSYLLGEIDYVEFVQREANQTLQYALLTHLFVVIAACFLAVGLMNLLIGLAVGDIDKIKKIAVIKQRTDKMRIFKSIDKWLCSCILQHVDKRCITVYPNKPVNVVRKWWRLLWRALKEGHDEQDEQIEAISFSLQSQKQIFRLQDQIKTLSLTQMKQHEEVKQLIESLTTLVTSEREDVRSEISLPLSD